ncbi:hypothetical protein HW555_012689 [Spodoptera exigua]|uniref:Uncharacterized protein n=1 Tax=Spodoptera exigua TaxID=7107 RepID=A0A835KYU2_SPOEX|nr:hypothetical protein HW555_012689 [Spodoptera exigua]
MLYAISVTLLDIIRATWLAVVVAFISAHRTCTDTTGKLPEQINDTDGYHRNCYNSFTALMAKYRNLSEINFSSAVDLPSTSSSASTSNTEVSVQTTLSDETSENSHTEVNVQDIDTSNTTILPDSLSKKSDDNFEKKFRNFDPSSLPPSTMRTDERNHYGQPGSPYDIHVRWMCLCSGTRWLATLHIFRCGAEHTAAAGY